MIKRRIAAVAIAVWMLGGTSAQTQPQQRPQADCTFAMLANKPPGVNVVLTPITEPFKVLTCYSTATTFGRAYIDLVIVDEPPRFPAPVLSSAKVMHIPHFERPTDHLILGAYSFSGSPINTTAGTRKIRLPLTEMYPKAPAIKPDTELRFHVILTAVDGKVVTVPVTMKITGP